eukprot:366195-Chlamydomonas_euryale.AAC.7
MSGTSTPRTPASPSVSGCKLFGCVVMTLRGEPLWQGWLFKPTAKLQITPLCKAVSGVLGRDTEERVSSFIKTGTRHAHMQGGAATDLSGATCIHAYTQLLYMHVCVHAVGPSTVILETRKGLPQVQRPVLLLRDVWGNWTGGCLHACMRTCMLFIVLLPCFPVQHDRVQGVCMVLKKGVPSGRICYAACAASCAVTMPKLSHERARPTCLHYHMSVRPTAVQPMQARTRLLACAAT